MKTLSDYVRIGTYKAGADTFSKIVTLGVIVGAARTLAPEAFGVLALAMTSGWLLGVASDAGLPLHLARAAAREGRAVGPTFRWVVRLRIGFGAAALAAGVGVAAWLAPPALVLAFGLIVAAQLLGAIVETAAHLFRGLGRVDLEATLTIAHRSATGALVLVALLSSPGLLSLAVALVAAPALALVAALVVARRVLGDGDARGGTAARSPEHAGSMRFARDAAPIGVGVLLSALYFRCDVYFIEYWHSYETVGLYNAAFRLVEALRLLPAAALAVTFPDLCRAQSFVPLRRVGGAVTAAGLVLLAALLLTAPAVISLIYGEAYLPAASPLRLLALAVPFFFLNYALTHQVIGWDGHHAYARIAGVALVANLTANLALVPAHGMAGAAVATLVTELVVTTGCVVALRAEREMPRAAPVEVLR